MLRENKLFLKELNNHFCLVRQWVQLKDWNRALNYRTKLEGYIELLEIESCGSVGGFDKGQTERSTLTDRYKWLIKKHNITVPEETRVAMIFCKRYGM